jgi:hypothetical protein
MIHNVMYAVVFCVYCSSLRESRESREQRRESREERAERKEPLGLVVTLPSRVLQGWDR